MSYDKVKLHPPDGSTPFNIKAESIEREVDSRIIIETIVSEVSKHVAGGEVHITLDKVVIQGSIQNMKASDYPNSSKYDGSDANHPDDDDYGYEQEITTAARTWGPEMNGLAELEWDGRILPGHIDNVRTTERLQSGGDVGRTYDLELEFINIDIDTTQT